MSVESASLGAEDAAVAKWNGRAEKQRSGTRAHLGSSCQRSSCIVGNVVSVGSGPRAPSPSGNEKSSFTVLRPRLWPRDVHRITIWSGECQWKARVGCARQIILKGGGFNRSPQATPTLRRFHFNMHTYCRTHTNTHTHRHLPRRLRYLPPHSDTAEVKEVSFVLLTATGKQIYIYF